MRVSISILLICVFGLGCTEVNTDDPQESFKYWSGQKPSNNFHVINGKYWQSPHWTKEYIVYLQLKTTPEWWNDYIKENHLPIDTSTWTFPPGAPKWFKPPQHCVTYGFNDEFDNSRYFWDSTARVGYIYEIQL